MSDEPVRRQPDLLTVAPRAEKPCYFLSLKVENVRSFGSPQTLDLSDGHDRPSQWTILLGDNGSGKTTLLQSLAAIVPRDFSKPSDSPEQPSRKTYVPEVLLPVDGERYRTFLRFGSGTLRISALLAHGAKLNEKEARSSRHQVSVELNRGGGGSIGGGTSSHTQEFEDLLVYGYGAARRIGFTSLSEARDNDPRATLFDENCSLLNAEEWLLQADYAAEKSKDPKAVERLQRIKDILVRLLPDVDELRIRPSGTQTPFVEAQTPYGWVMMRALS